MVMVAGVTVGSTTTRFAPVEAYFTVKLLVVVSDAVAGSFTVLAVPEYFCAEPQPLRAFVSVTMPVSPLDTIHGCVMLKAFANVPPTNGNNRLESSTPQPVALLRKYSHESTPITAAFVARTSSPVPVSALLHPAASAPTVTATPNANLI